MPDVLSLTLPMPPSDDALRESYAELRSVWKVGERYGMPGQTVHNRLRRMGVDTSANLLTEADYAKIQQYYLETDPDDFDLDALARDMRRTKHVICRAARKIGLTDMRRPASRQDRIDMSARARLLWKDRPHPRGYLGHTHGPESRQLMSAASKRAWATMKTFNIGNMHPDNLERVRLRMARQAAKRTPESTYSRAATGRRPDLGDAYFRSSWEANYARYLNLLVKMGVVEWWDYEQVTFWFEGVRRGTLSYKPDFRIKYKGDSVLEHVEIKGWVTPKDRTKWKRMKKYHPDIKLIVVGQKQYNAIRNKWASAIPHWEHKATKASVAAMQSGADRDDVAVFVQADTGP